MKVVIAGGRGLIGRALSARLVQKGIDVVVLTRDASGQAPEGRVRQVEWAPDGKTAAWALDVDGADAVVNLAGAGIADGRWTSARKSAIRSSRVLATRSLVAAVRRASHKPGIFVQGSAVGFYGATLDDQICDESFPPGDDFLSDTAVAWEAEAHPVSVLGARLVIVRTGIALAPRGGVLERMKRPFQFFVGGPVASGRQYVSWIHIDDWVALVEWALTTPSVTGVLNAAAPEPVTNRALSDAIAHALRRPSWIPVPAFLLHALYGEMADALLIKGQRVVPSRAVEQGFTFAHPTIAPALDDVFRRTRS